MPSLSAFLGTVCTWGKSIDELYNTYLLGKNMTKSKDKTKWCIPVTNALDVALEQAVARDSHISKSEFVRDVVRRKLEEMGFHPQVFANTEVPAA
jgi:hypothetical protein